MTACATPNLCCDCGSSGAAIQMIDAEGRVSPGPYCWDCAAERSTPVPDRSALAAVLCFVAPAWLRSRAGASWLARRLDAGDG